MAHDALLDIPSIRSATGLLEAYSPETIQQYRAAHSDMLPILEVGILMGPEDEVALPRTASPAQLRVAVTVCQDALEVGLKKSIDALGKIQDHLTRRRRLRLGAQFVPVVTSSGLLILLFGSDTRGGQIVAAVLTLVAASLAILIQESEKPIQERGLTYAEAHQMLIKFRAEAATLLRSLVVVNADLEVEGAHLHVRDLLKRTDEVCHQLHELIETVLNLR